MANRDVKGISGVEMTATYINPQPTHLPKCHCGNQSVYIMEDMKAYCEDHIPRKQWMDYLVHKDALLANMFFAETDRRYLI